METKIYEPVAFTVVAFILTWFFIVVMQQVTKIPFGRYVAALVRLVFRRNSLVAVTADSRDYSKDPS